MKTHFKIGQKVSYRYTAILDNKSILLDKELEVVGVNILDFIVYILKDGDTLRYVPEPALILMQPHDTRDGA